MGYRSKVIIGIKEGVFSKRFEGILQKNDFKLDNSSTYFKNCLVDDFMVYQFEQIKWYEHDGWCKEIMDWVHETSENDDNAFCVGMGYDDGSIHSEVGTYWNYVDVIRDINLTKIN